MGIFDRVVFLLKVVKDRLLKKDTEVLKERLQIVLDELSGNIPVFIICYNNILYVENMVKQLKRYNIKPIIIDNNSQDFDTIKGLKKLESDAYVVYSKKNLGYLVGFINSVYEILPKYFVYTDPDLQLNQNLPKDFLEVLKSLSEEFRVYKVGFALELLDEEMINSKIKKYNGYPKIKEKSMSVKEWEERFWRFKIEHNKLELYRAPIDTTFALYNKDNLSDDFFDAIRVAGDFSCVHLPWYPKRDILTDREKQIYKKDNNSSSWV